MKVNNEDHYLAEDLATRAGLLLLEERKLGRDADPETLKQKGDKESHNFLMEELASARPEDGVLSEEGSANPVHPNRSDTNRVWIVDPLDGTREFGELERDDWAVHVSLAINGLPVVGAVAIPALLAAYLAGHYEKWWTSSGLLVLVLLSRADLGLAVAAIGVIFFLENRKVVGRVVTFLGLLWFLLMAFWVQPSIGLGHYPHITAFRHFGEGSLDVIFGMLSDPFGLLKDLLVRTNFEQVILIIAPVLFLTLIHLRYVLPAVPLLIFYLIADVPVGVLGNPQQDVAVLAVAFIAATYALMKMGSTGVSRILVGRRILTVLLLTATVFFIRDSASSPFEKPWEWGRRDETDIARVTSVFWLGPDASVAAPANLYPEIAERKNAFVIKIDVPFEPSSEQLKHLDAVIFDENIVAWTNAELIKFERKMGELGFDRRYDSKGIHTWIRKPGSD